MQQKAFDVAQKWIGLNYRAYLKDGKMWEKYDVTKPYEKKAAGGEYEIQVTFIENKIMRNFWVMTQKISHDNHRIEVSRAVRMMIKNVSVRLAGNSKSMSVIEN